MKKPNVIWSPFPGSQKKFMKCPVWECLLHGNRGGGKRLPNDYRVLGERGWVKLKDLQIGALVYARDGRLYPVTGIFPQGISTIYKMTLQDGRVIECGDEHLWSVVDARMKPKVINTIDMMNAGLSIGPEGKKQWKFRIPNCEPIPWKEKTLPIKPYFLGCLISEGTLTTRTPKIATSNKFILDLFKKEFNEFKFSWDKSTTCNHTIVDQGRGGKPFPGIPIREKHGRRNRLTDAIEFLGLNVKCHDKFIPKMYKHGSTRQRLDLLAGLMDTDGSISCTGNSEFVSASKQLVNDFAYVCRSLGIRCRIAKDDRVGRNIEIRGKTYVSGLVYRVYINTSLALAKDPKKIKNAAKKKHSNSSKYISIVGIKKTNKKTDMVCISVDSPDHTYLIKDFVVTHNTDVLIMDYLQGVGKGYGADYRGLLLREATTELGDVIAKCKKWIPRIFPSAKYNGSKKMWTFEQGETLLLSYARTEEDYDQYHGWEIPWCVEENTEVLMGNNEHNEHKKIKHISVGEYVQTLEGAKKVLRITPSNKQGVTVSFYAPGTEAEFGSQIQGISHQILSSFGMHNGLNLPSHQKSLQYGTRQFSWLSYKFQQNDDLYVLPLLSFLQNLQSLTESILASSTLSNFVKVLPYSFRIFSPSSAYQSLDKIGKYLSFLKTESQENFFFSTNDRTFYTDIEKEYLSLRQFLRYCIHFFPEHSKLFDPKIYWGFLDCEYSYEKICSLIQDFQYGCLLDSNHNDAQVHQDQEIYSNTVPSFFDAQEPILYPLLCKDDLDFSRANEFPKAYVHPYTAQLKDSVFCPSVLASCKASPVINNVNLYDLTVSDASHYITKIKENQLLVNSSAPKYLINKNCGWEELTNHALPTVYLKLMSCNRSSNPNVPLKYRATCNPSGPGHSWVKQRFIDRCSPGKIYKEEIEFEYPDDQGVMQKQIKVVARTHVKSYMSENKALLEADPMYMAKIYTLTKDNEMLRKAWIDGSWDLLIGGFFTDVWDKDTHVLPTFKVPSSWTLSRSFDWGSSKPWAVTYFFETNGEQPNPNHLLGLTEIPFIPKGSVIIPTEIYGWNGTPNEGDRAISSEIAQRVLQVDNALLTEYNTRCIPGPADTSIYDVRDGTSIGAELERHGCKWTKAYKGSGSRIAGWAIIRQMLGAAKRRDLESPHLYFFASAEHHIRTLPMQQRDKKKPEDINCFIAGTMVEMENGQKKIENVKVGDTVKTPIGLRKVKKAGVSGFSKVARVLFGETELIGTLDHKVFVKDEGLIPLNKIVKESILCQKSLRILEGSNSPVKMKDILNAITVIVNFLMEQHYCTEQNGNIILARFLKNMKYITKTKSDLIVVVKILNCFMAQITQDSTCKKECKKVGIVTKNLKHGESLQKVKSSLSLILKNAVKILPNENLRALTVVSLLLQNMDQRNSVLLSAKSKFQEKYKKNVLSVENFSGPNGTTPEKRKLVVTSVDGNYGEAMVYNLTVEQSGMYYANEVLVSNTDGEDHCFVYDTEVITSVGTEKIGNLVGGSGKILSVNGQFVDFSNCRLTRKDVPVVKITFSDGHSVICTLDHRFLTSKGFVAANDILTCLTLSDMLCIVSKPILEGERKCAGKKEKQLSHCQTHSKSFVEKFITNAVNISKRMANVCIRQYGSIIKEKFQRDFTYTIKNQEQKITLKICRNFQGASIYLCIKQVTADLLQKIACLKRLSGIKGRKGKNGTINITKTQKLHSIKKLKEAVSFVGALLLQSEKIPIHSAPIIAKQNGGNDQELMMLKESVSYVPVHSQLINIGQDKHVQVHAHQNYVLGITKISILEQRQDVYCLEAHNTHTFALKNGVIVSNCMDSMRYGLARKLTTMKRRSVRN